MSSITAAEAIFEAIDVQGLLLEGANPIIDLYADEFGYTPNQVRHVFASELDWDALRDVWKEELVTNFTEEELHQLAAFHTSPIGQKSLTVLPSILESAAGRTESIIERSMESILRRLDNRELLSLA